MEAANPDTLASGFDVVGNLYRTSGIGGFDGGEDGRESMQIVASACFRFDAVFNTGPEVVQVVVMALRANRVGVDRIAPDFGQGRKESLFGVVR